MVHHLFWSKEKKSLIETVYALYMDTNLNQNAIFLSFFFVLVFDFAMKTMHFLFLKRKEKTIHMLW